MYSEKSANAESSQLAVRMYDSWLRDRQRRREQLRVPKGREDIEEVRRHNFAVQTLEPRREALAQLAEVGDRMTTADKVALLVTAEMSTVEASALLHRLGIQVANDPEAVYFSKVNMADNCGSGCGCGCATLAELPYEERIALHKQLKPFSIDPFNEIGITQEERDALLVKDFLSSYEGLTDAVRDRIQARYFRMGQEFA